GLKPFAAIYSTFLQRAYDQVVHDIAIQRLPVRFAIDRAGLVGADGPTHAGSFDLAYLGCLPGFVIMAAADEAELMHMVATAAAIDDRPSALRYPRGEGVGVEMPEQGTPLEIGRGRVLRLLSEQGVLDRGIKVRTMVLPDIFLDHDKPERMYAQAGLDAAGIAAKVMTALGKSLAPSQVKLLAGGGKVA